MKADQRGQVLPIVMVTMLVLLIIIGGIVSWMQNNSKLAVKNQKTVTAINFAETGIDRAQWKLQSTTTTWTAAAAGVVLPGFNFDTTYTDIPGGTYRIKISSAGNNSVTIVGEGRDSATKETRAISAVYKNQTIYGAIMSGGNVSWARGLVVWWGPIMSQGNITLQDDFVASLYFPRKFAKGVVTGTAANPRDINGLAPPNTDNVEWWSDYTGVPPLPLLDFASLRSSAAATGTLNVYGCKGTGAAWDLRNSCGSSAPHATHFGDSTNYIIQNLIPGKDYVWYWDGDVTLSGDWNCAPGSPPCNRSTAMRGTIIVRGNLTIDTPGDFVYNGHVPINAWQEENKLTKATFDSGASQEYPADIGLHTSAPTWNFGTDSWCQPTQGCGWTATVGLKGFTYVGGNLTILQFLDFHGAVWVNGNVNASGGDATHFCSIFFDDTLNVPALNVILLRQSWQETSPSKTAWP